MTKTDSQTAVLLIAHGSRRAEANADLEWVAAQLQPRIPGWPIQICYLELARPSIPEGLAACAATGATTIAMVPYFLSAGAHVTRDLEHQRALFLGLNPNVDCLVCQPIGLHTKIIEVLEERLAEGLQRQLET